MITKSCWNGAASGRFSGVGRSVPYAMGVFGNQRELAGNDAFPCGAGRSPPPTRELKVSATTRASGAQRSVCASGRKGWAGNGAEIIPKGVINLGQSLSHGCAVTAPFAQGSLGDEGCGSPRRFAPRNDSPKPLSFRGGPTDRGGNPSFFTMDGGRAAEVVGPYGRSTEAPATGRCGHRPLRKAQSTTQASRRAAKRPRLRPRGMGGNRRKDHLKMGTAAATAGAALSEAESAERAAGQMRSLPDNLRVQHGAEGSEVC